MAIAHGLSVRSILICTAVMNIQRILTLSKA